MFIKKILYKLFNSFNEIVTFEEKNDIHRL